MLVVVTHEIENESFLVNELQEIASHFTRVIVITTGKIHTSKQQYEIIASKRTDFLLSSVFYSIKKLFSKELIGELRERKKMRVKPSFGSLIYKCIFTWMIENRLNQYLNKIWKGEEIILYSYWLNAYAYFVAKIKKRHPHINAISRAHGFEIRDFGNYIPFRKTIDTYLDKIIFISNYTKMEYGLIMRGDNLMKRAERSVIYLGVKNMTIPKFKASSYNHLLTIVSCSGIYRLKRLDLLIDALAGISEKIRLNWIHFGTGSDFEVMADYAMQKLTKGNVTYTFKGQLSNSEILQYYEENYVDIFINTSDYEGIPVSIMEAMSYGIPCIARNVGGNSEIVIDQISGKLLPKESSAAFIADVIKTFFYLKSNDSEGSTALRISTYNHWFTNFNSTNNYKTFVNYMLDKNDLNDR